MSRGRKIGIAIGIAVVALVAAGAAYAVTFGADLRVTIRSRPVGFVIPGLRTRSALAATVNDEPIYWSEVDQEVARAAAQFNVTLSGAEGGKQRAELTGVMIDRLIDERLIVQAARKRGGEANDAQVDAEMARITEQLGGAQGLQAALSQRNLTMVDARRIVRLTLTVRALMPLVTEVKVSDDEVRKSFTERRAQFDEAEQVRASHILIRASTPQEEERAKQTIVLIRGRLAKGEKFADLAKQYSEDPGSKSNGGDLGFVAKGSLVPEFEKVAFSLKPAEVSPPVKTQFGYHLILVAEHKPARQATFAQVQGQIREQLLQQKREAAFQKWLEAARKQATIKRFPRPS